MINRKIEIFKEPYIRKANNKSYGTNVIMIDFIISLLPIILIGWYQNGIKVFINNKNFYSLIYPLLFVLLGGLFSYLIEVLYFCFYNKLDNPFKKSWFSYSIIPGLLLSIILPLKTPVWVLFIGCVAANIIAKMIFGGFGNNIFNPALVGYIFIMTAFYSIINSNNGGDALSSSTPLSNITDLITNKISIEELLKNKSLIDLLLELKSGTIGETSVIACLISYLYLVIRKVINYKIPLFCLLSFFISSFIIGYFININPIRFSLYNLFTGGIIFGAIFMVTEPVSSPKSVYGKYIYSIFIGILVIVLRLLSDLKDGTSTAILFMNMLSFIIDNMGAKIRVQTKIMKILKPICLLLFIYIFINSYTILTIRSLNNSDNDIENVNPEIEINIVNIKQDYSKLNNNEVEFIYTLNINNINYVYNCDIDGNIKIDNNEYDNENLKEEVKKFLINNKVNKRSTNMNKHYGYVVEVIQENTNEYIITGYSRGYVNDVIITIHYKDNQIIETNVNLQKETQLQGGLENSTGSINDLINIGKGNKSDIVSNVTYTSVSLLTCRKAIIDYINNILGGNLE